MQPQSTKKTRTRVSAIGIFLVLFCATQALNSGFAGHLVRLVLIALVLVLGIQEMRYRRQRA